MYKLFYLFFALLISLSGCSKPQNENGNEPEVEPEIPVVTEANPAIVALGWTNVGEDYGDLHKSIKVYRSPNTLEGKKAIAYIAVGDLNKGAEWDVLGDLSYCDDSSVKNYGAPSLNTPTQFYEKEKAAIIINAGLFFYAPKSDNTPFYSSQNLAFRNGTMIASNQNYYSEDWQTIWYPTVGAFCQDKQNNFFTTWTYNNYAYSSPAENSMSKEPLPVPNASFPVTAVDIKSLKIQTAIGGVGVLIKDGVVVNTWEEELLNVSADSSQPRTAIGYNKTDNRLIFFVCEGRNMTEGVAGLTTGEVANVLKSLGCTEALNLDGGGSSCMLINGQETIKPSDGHQRSVLTGLKMF